jgi:hypothetical protein
MVRTARRSFVCALGVLIALGEATLPARADSYSGAYSCVTNTGMRIGVVLIQNGGDITGSYIGHDQIAGRISGKLDDEGVVYTWSQRKDDAANEQDDGGWGRMTFSGGAAITAMRAVWGRTGSNSAIGSWTCGAPL